MREYVEHFFSGETRKVNSILLTYLLTYLKFDTVLSKTICRDQHCFPTPRLHAI